MADTTTTLNLGAGGDVMDESLVTQGDGSTQAKRPRVELAHSAKPGTPLVRDDLPQPVADEVLRGALLQIADDIHAIRMLLTSALEE